MAKPAYEFYKQAEQDELNSVLLQKRISKNLKDLDSDPRHLLEDARTREAQMDQSTDLTPEEIRPIKEEFESEFKKLEHEIETKKDEIKKGFLQRLSEKAKKNPLLSAAIISAGFHVPLIPEPNISIEKTWHTLTDVLPRRVERTWNSDPAKEVALKEKLQKKFDQGERVSYQETIFELESANGFSDDELEEAKKNMLEKVERLKSERGESIDREFLAKVVSEVYSENSKETYDEGRSYAGDLFANGKGNCEARAKAATMLLENVMTEEEKKKFETGIQFYEKHERAVIQIGDETYALEPGVPLVTQDDRVGTVIVSAQEELEIFSTPKDQPGNVLKPEPGLYEKIPGGAVTDTIFNAVKERVHGTLRQYGSEEHVAQGRPTPPERQFDVQELEILHEEGPEIVRDQKRSSDFVFSTLGYTKAFKFDLVSPSVDAVKEMQPYENSEDTMRKVADIKSINNWTSEAFSELVRLKYPQLWVGIQNDERVPSAFIEAMKTHQSTSENGTFNHLHIFQFERPDQLGKMAPDNFADIIDSAQGVDTLEFSMNGLPDLEMYHVDLVHQKKIILNLDNQIIEAHQLKLLEKWNCEVGIDAGSYVKTLHKVPSLVHVQNIQPRFDDAAVLNLLSMYTFMETTPDSGFDRFQNELEEILSRHLTYEELEQTHKYILKNGNVPEEMLKRFSSI